MKKTWKGINELISSRAKSPVNISQIKSDDEILINDPSKIANSFNDFFVNVGTNLDKIIPKTPISPLSYLRSRVANGFKFKLTTIAEVMMLLLQLDDSKAVGSKDIPIPTLKIAAPVIVPYIVSIFNLSLQTGNFPNALKLAKVIRIFKTGQTYLIATRP